ncbi:hypothetical protein [Streptomyces sp. enrichment culture]|uniref:hypothetical protein n=1 Tax=Streptomyces sp. enrichment culture TaxID=1795815 RepID=UPI003F5476D6
MASTGRDVSGAAGATELVTGCGRRIVVKCLRLVPEERTLSRVTLDVGGHRDGGPGVWASLTATEARELARQLLERADVADHAPGGVATALA